jgi:hypothetical protein
MKMPPPPAGGGGTTLVEQLLEEALSALVAGIMIIPMPTAVPRLVAAPLLRGDSRVRRGRSGGRRWCAPFDDLVEFAAVEPDAPALRAIVDLDALPLGHG